CFGFYFLGLPPRQPDQRKQALDKAGRLGRPLIMLDTPYRMKHLLTACHEVYAATRRGFVAVDISGPGEDFWLGSFKELATKAAALDGTQNFVLIVEDVQIEE